MNECIELLEDVLEQWNLGYTVEESVKLYNKALKVIEKAKGECK